MEVHNADLSFIVILGQQLNFSEISADQQSFESKHTHRMCSSIV